MQDENFNDFLKENKSKIISIAAENPSISKDDEWRTEDIWNNKQDNKEKINNRQV